MSEIWEHAADIVADWFAFRRPPRDAIAARPALRALPAADRAAIARLAHEVVARQRWLGFVVAGSVGLGDRAPHPRAAALVLTRLVECGEMDAGKAQRLVEQQLRSAIAGIDLAAASARLLSIDNPQQRFAIGHSLPDWLAARCVAEFGADATAVAAAWNEAPPRTIRANLLRVASRETLAASLLSAGISTRPTQFAPHGLHVLGDCDLFATALYRQGAFEQQDEASQLAAMAVAPPPRGRVLDLCAGSGGKTLALAAAMQNRGELLAVDVHEGRLLELRQRARRAAVSNLRVRCIASNDWTDEVRTFARTADRVLIDAPCSGSGSFRRRPEGRWSVDEAGIAALMEKQDDLLARVAAVLQPGARLVYATCSLFADENAARVALLCERNPGLEIARLAEVLGGVVARPIADASGASLSTRPDRHGCDGFYAAILRRRR